MITPKQNNKEKGIFINKDHLTIFSNEYPIAEIERASIYANHTSYRGPIFLFIMGLLFTIGHLITGVTIMGAAVIWGLSIRKKYSLILTVNGKEKSVLVHNDKKILEELLKTIGESKGKG